jgi:hypothetical protein
MRDGVRHTVHESQDFTPKGNRAERVQTVNGRGKGSCGRNFVRRLFYEIRLPRYRIMH